MHIPCALCIFYITETKNCKLKELLPFLKGNTFTGDIAVKPNQPH